MRNKEYESNPFVVRRLIAATAVASTAVTTTAIAATGICTTAEVGSGGRVHCNVAVIGGVVAGHLMSETDGVYWALFLLSITVSIFRRMRFSFVALFLVSITMAIFRRMRSSFVAFGIFIRLFVRMFIGIVILLIICFVVFFGLLFGAVITDLVVAFGHFVFLVVLLMVVIDWALPVVRVFDVSDRMHFTAGLFDQLRVDIGVGDAHEVSAAAVLLLVVLSVVGQFVLLCVVGPRPQTEATEQTHSLTPVWERTTRTAKS